MEVPSAEHFYQEHDFSAYEPFTLIVYEQQRLYQIVHNPSETFITEMDAREHQIWSSTKLYNSNTRAERSSNFRHWLATKPVLSAQALRDFHLRGSNQMNFQGFKLKIDNLIETVSLTQVSCQAEGSQMHYANLLANTQSKKVF